MSMEQLNDDFDVENVTPGEDIGDGSVDMDRRMFLHKAAMAATVASVPLGVATQIYGEDIIGETLGREGAERSLLEVRGRLREKYGIEVDFGPVGTGETERGIQGETIGFLVEQRKMCEVIEATLMQYPLMMIKKRATISRIRVVDDLTLEDDRGVAGLAQQEVGDVYLEHTEHHSSNLDMKLDAFFLSLNESQKARELGLVFHHEFEHMVDDVEDLVWDRDVRGLDYDKPIPVDQLQYLYVPEIDYLEKHQGMKPEFAKKYRSIYPGFTCLYGKKNRKEDRATLIEYLYRDPAGIERRLPRDPELAQKIEFMKKDYFVKSRGVMNEEYWDLVARHPGSAMLVTEFIKLRTQQLLRMSDADFRSYMQAQTGRELSDGDIRVWKEEIGLGMVS